MSPPKDEGGILTRRVDEEGYEGRGGVDHLGLTETHIFFFQS